MGHPKRLGDTFFKAYRDHSLYEAMCPSTSVN